MKQARRLLTLLTCLLSPVLWIPATLTAQQVDEKELRTECNCSWERVERAFVRVTMGKTFSADEERWLERIREHLRANLSIEQDDFEVIPIFADAGGWGVARKVFGATKLEALLHELNEAIAA